MIYTLHGLLRADAFLACLAIIPFIYSLHIIYFRRRIQKSWQQKPHLPICLFRSIMRPGASSQTATLRTIWSVFPDDVHDSDLLLPAPQRRDLAPFVQRCSCHRRVAQDFLENEDGQPSSSSRVIPLSPTLPVWYKWWLHRLCVLCSVYQHRDDAAIYCFAIFG